MEKKIIIGVDNDGNNEFKIENMNPMEALGLLRFYEKHLWLKILNSSQEKQPETDKDRIKITHFVSDNPEMSTRLKNGLLEQDYQTKEFTFPYLDCVNRRDFMRVRNVGKDAWKEFETLIHHKGYKIGI